MLHALGCRAPNSAARQRAEDGIGSLLEAVIAASPHEGSGFVYFDLTWRRLHWSCCLAGIFQEVFAEMQIDRRSREVMQQTAFAQVQEVKALLREQRRRGGGGGSSDKGTAQQRDLATSVCADVFLRLRNSLNDHWLELKNLERVCAEHVATSRRQIAKSVQLSLMIP